MGFPFSSMCMIRTVIRFHLGKPVIGEKGQGLELVGKIQEQTGKQSLVPGFYSALHIKEADQKDTGQNDPTGHRIERRSVFSEVSGTFKFPPLFPVCSPPRGR